MPQIPNPQILGKLQNLVVKNPLGFVATVFFFTTFVTYFLIIRRSGDAEQNWKELYLKERAEKDELKNELLIRAGIIERQNMIIKEVDSTLRDNTELETTKILNNEK